MSSAFISTISQHIEKEGGVNKGCKKVARLLNNRWTWKHIYKVYRGLSTPGKELTRKLNALRLPKPLRKRYRLTVEMNNETDYKQFKKLTMEQRLCAFREKSKL